MTPLKPYLIRAINEWILENGMTPYLLVNADKEDVFVPEQFVQDGRIIMNLRPEAIQDLSLGTEHIEFGAMFNGTPMQVSFPATAVLAIYAKENGKGMVFDEDEDTPPPGPSDGDDSSEKSSRPALKIVK